MPSPRRSRRSRPIAKQMAEFAEMRTMDVWYARLSEQELMSGDQGRHACHGADRQARRPARPRRKPPRSRRRKAHTRDSLQALSKLAELVDGRYRIVSQPPVVIPLRDLAPRIGLSVDEMRARDPRAVPRLPRDVARRSPPAARAVRDRRHGPQGRGRRQRRDAGVHRAAAGSRPGRPVVLAGQGGDRVGAGRPPAEEPLPPARRTSGPGPTA